MKPTLSEVIEYKKKGYLNKEIVNYDVYFWEYQLIRLEAFISQALDRNSINLLTETRIIDLKDNVKKIVEYNQNEYKEETYCEFRNLINETFDLYKEVIHVLWL